MDVSLQAVPVLDSAGCEGQDYEKKPDDAERAIIELRSHKDILPQPAGFTSQETEGARK
jgi:hypothetical protein